MEDHRFSEGPVEVPVLGPETLQGALLRAERDYSSRGVTLVFSREREERRSFADLVGGIRDMAARLAGFGVGPGDRVVVSLSTSWAWLESWFGALWLGALPLAVAPGASGASLRRLNLVLDRLEGARVVATSSLVEEAERGRYEDLLAAIITTESLAETAPEKLPRAFEAEPSSAAFLQLTSGSTAAPRAVVISHSAALHNICAVDKAARPAENTAPIDSCVSWLPLHHDMGLVACLLNCVVQGYELFLLSPRRFVGDPFLWLRLLSGPGSFYSTAPNFGYQRCVEQARGGAGADLDLSRWRSTLCGAEMIHPETVEAFTRIFGPWGFAADAFRSSYGLAENTVGVSVERHGKALRTAAAIRGGDSANATGGANASEVVCVGPPVAGTEIRIVGEDGRTAEERYEGEIRIRGPSLFLGYYNDPAATAEALEDGWLRTGDTGFLLDGELYLTGRLKDLLIVHGQNVAPHELEWLASSVDGEGGSFCRGAFSVARGVDGEAAVLVLETSRDLAQLRDLERAVRLRVAHELTLSLSDLVFVRRGRIPKTTSGKVQRHELKRRYVAGELGRLDVV